MNALVAVLVFGIGLRLIPAAPTEAALLVVCAVALVVSELRSTRRSRLGR